MIDIDLNENYSEEVEKIIGYAPSTRSLRTLFDPFASEWGDIRHPYRSPSAHRTLEKRLQPHQTT